MASIEADLKEVLDNYKKKLTPDEEKKFASTTLKDLKDAITGLQDDQRKSKTVRNLAKMQKFLSCMSQYQTIIEIAKNLSTAFDVILDTYEQFAKNFPLLEQYRALFKENEYMQQILVWIYEDLLKFHLQAWRVLSRPTWKKMFNASWHDFQQSTKPILDNMIRHRELIERAAELQHIEESRGDTLKLIQACRDAKSLTQASLDAIKQGDDDRKFSTVLEWLAAIDSSEDQEHFTSQKGGIAKTGHWILSMPKIIQFLDPAQCAVPTFWLHGIPGAGKTILASVIIEQASRVAQSGSSSLVYFYCRDSETKNTFVGVAKSIIAQFLRQHRETLLPYLYDESKKIANITLKSPQRCAVILDTILNEVKKTVIVIDGLDECEPKERKLILKFFVSAITKSEESSPGKLRGLFVSQELPDIKSALQNPESLRLTEDHTKLDIRNYAIKRAASIQQHYKRLPNEAKDAIVKLICEGSDGMFLFAKLVLDNLHAQENLEDLYKEMNPDTFPSGFDQAYERIVKRIFNHSSPAKQVTARRILGWVTCARRPLSWREIQAASCIDTNQRCVSFKSRQLADEIRDICGSLVDILPGDRVQLVHSTAKHYLFHEKWIFEQKEERSLSLLCLDYLNFDCFEASISDDSLAEFVLDGSYAFTDYSCLHWSDHLECATSSLTVEELTHQMPLGMALNEFILLNNPDPVPGSSIYKELAKKCEQLKASECYETVLQLISSAKAARIANEKLETLGALGVTVTRVRRMLHQLSSSPDLDASAKQALQLYYGKNLYKCSRHACYYFHEGFANESLLEQHTSRHDKPYCCTEIGCTRMYIGWATEKDLKKHKSQYHPDPESLAFKFPHVKKMPTVFQCESCPKVYGRASSLKVHVQREHLKERKFLCKVCEKSFVTKYDCDRHENTHDSGTQSPKNSQESTSNITNLDALNATAPNLAKSDGV